MTRSKWSLGGYVSPVVLAWAHVGLDEADDTFSYLEGAFDERKGWLLHINVEPMLAPLRQDPRLDDLARRIGLPAPGQATVR